MYSLLYESMLAWYARRRVAESYVHLYAVTTLTSMAFVNAGSIVELLVYYDFWWARKLFAAWPLAVALFIGLLVLHLWCFRRGQPLLAPRSSTRTPWLAPAYGLLSVVVFL